MHVHKCFLFIHLQLSFTSLSSDVSLHHTSEYWIFWIPLSAPLVSFRGATDRGHSSAPTRTSRLRAAYTESYLDFPSRNTPGNPVKLACQRLRDVWLFQGWMCTFSFDFGEHWGFLGRSSLSWLLGSYSICCGYVHPSRLFKAFFAFNVLSILELYKT